MTVSAGFNLYTQAWIPVIRDGCEQSASLRTCIVDAHLIDGLSVIDGPTFAGCLRLLLALVLDAYGQPAGDAQWRERLDLGHFDPAVLDDYVEQVGVSRFDLFDKAFPFMQSVTTPFQNKTVAELLPHVACGNRTPIFTPDTDDTPRRLTFAQAARALVATQMVAVPNPGRAAGDDPEGSWKGVQFGGRAGVIGFCCPVGVTLFDTLLLNTVNGAHQRLDAVDLPVWRRENIPPSRRKRAADGMVDLLTWTPRRVRLVAEDDQVSRICFRGGDALIALDNAHEPHTALQLSEGRGNVPAGQWYPRKHQLSTLGWRGIPQLLALGEHHSDSRPPQVLSSLGNRLEDLPPDYRVTVLSMLVTYGEKAAVIDDITTDTYPLPVRAFGEAETDVRDSLVYLVQTADRIRYQLQRYAQDLFSLTQRDLQLDDDPKKERRASKSYAGTVTEQFSTRVDSMTRRFLVALNSDAANLAESMATWVQQLRGLADETVESVKIDCGLTCF